MDFYRENKDFEIRILIGLDKTIAPMFFFAFKYGPHIRGVQLFRKFCWSLLDGGMEKKKRNNINNHPAVS